MRFGNILHLGVKELWSLVRDPMMILLVAYAFTASIYSTSTALPDTLHKAPIAIVDEDQSPLSQRIVNAFEPPLFLPPRMVSREEMDRLMDAGVDTFGLNIPPAVPGGRACSPHARDSAQRRCNPRRSGIFWQQLRASNHQRRGGDVCAALSVRNAAAGGCDGAGAFQRQSDPLVVRRRRGADRHDHYAVGPTYRSGLDPRARAGHRRAPAGHARDSVRDYDEQGLVDGAGRARRVRRLADVRGAGAAGRADPRLGRSVPLRPRCTCSPPRRWACSWPRLPGPCRNSPCCSLWCCCRSRCSMAG